MPFDGSGNYTLPAAYLAVAATTIQPTQHNTPLEDIATALTACIKANGSKAFTSEQLLAGNPSNVLGATPKQYVDAQVAAAVAASGITIKAPCVVCTTGNVTLSGEQTIDGTLTSATRILVAFQTAPAENGIYVTGSGGWARATDFDAWTEVASGYVPVERGTLWADTLWRTSADTGGTLNTTAINFRRIDGQWLRNAQTGTTYTVLQGDHNKHVTHSNASAIATTLPQATGNFGNGFFYISHNVGAGANTITPTTSTINGAATLVQKTNESHLISSDGTNYLAISLGLSYAQVAALTEDTTPVSDADFVVTADTSATSLKKVKPQNLISYPVLAAKTGNYTATTADRGKSIRFSGLSAGATLTLPAAASCGDGFLLYVKNEDTTFGASGPWALTVDGNASETIDGQTTRVCHTGSRLTLLCDGSNWHTVAGDWLFITDRRTIAAGDDANIAHGQGVAPKRIWPIFECTTDEHGYVAGDFVFAAQDSTSGGTLGLAWGGDATNLFYVCGASAVLRLFHKTTGAGVTPATGSWKLRLVAAF